MAFLMEDFQKGASVKGNLEQLSNTVTQGKQENQKRQRELDAYAKMDAMDTEAPPSLSTSAAPIDLTEPYAQLQEANKAVQQGQGTLDKLGKQLKEAAKTSDYATYEKMYKAEEAKVTAAQAARDKIATQEVQTVVAMGSSINQETGEGYETFAARIKAAHMANIAATAPAGSTPEQIAQQQADYKKYLDEQLPPTWGPKAKVGVREAMRHSLDTKTQLDLMKEDRLERESKRKEDKDAADHAEAMAKIDQTIATGGKDKLDSNLRAQNAVNTAANNTLTRYTVTQGQDGLTAQQRAQYNLDQATKAAKGWGIGDPSEKETTALNTAQAEYDRINKEITQAQKKLDDSQKMIDLLQSGKLPPEEPAPKPVPPPPADIAAMAKKAYGKDYDPATYEYGINPTTGNIARRKK